MKIPESTIKRLFQYHRVLKKLTESGADRISSHALSQLLESNDAQVRKDLAYFGQFGKRGAGYEVRGLAEEIAKILGLDKEKRVIMVGAGSLGPALAAYKGFGEQNFKIVALFDNNPNKIGRKVRGVTCYDPKEIPRIIKTQKVEIGVIAVPALAAQEVADELCRSGIKAILNFAPTRVVVPKGVTIRNVDLATEIQILAYYLP